MMTTKRVRERKHWPRSHCRWHCTRRAKPGESFRHMGERAGSLIQAPRAFLSRRQTELIAVRGGSSPAFPPRRPTS